MKFDELRDELLKMKFDKLRNEFLKSLEIRVSTLRTTNEEVANMSPDDLDRLGKNCLYVLSSMDSFKNIFL